MNIAEAAPRLQQALEIAQRFWPETVESIREGASVDYVRLHNALARRFGEPVPDHEPTPDDLIRLVMAKAQRSAA